MVNGCRYLPAQTGVAVIDRLLNAPRELDSENARPGLDPGWYRLSEKIMLQP
jgi:hypothetical protein